MLEHIELIIYIDGLSLSFSMFIATFSLEINYSYNNLNILLNDNLFNPSLYNYSNHKEWIISAYINEGQADPIPF